MNSSFDKQHFISGKDKESVQNFRMFTVSRFNMVRPEFNYIFHHFPKNLDRTITFNSVTLKNTQTEPQFFFFN